MQYWFCNFLVKTNSGRFHGNLIFNLVLNIYYTLYQEKLMNRKLVCHETFYNPYIEKNDSQFLKSHVAPATDLKKLQYSTLTFF